MISLTFVFIIYILAFKRCFTPFRTWIKYI